MISSSSRSLFVYGTLMAPEVMQTLVSRLPPCRPATLAGYSRHPVAGYAFPGIVASEKIKDSAARQTSVPGLLFTDLTHDELAILDWFEDREYTRTQVSVTSTTTSDQEDSRAMTQVYVWTNPLSELHVDRTWDYERFRRDHLSDYLVRVVEPCRLEFEREMKK
eukprot:scaffold1294_cov167-Amphora_coffeaeformis.AAC.4